MRKLIIAIIIFLPYLIYCQNANSFRNIKLVSYSNVWGVLKYYHPEIKKGKIQFEDWDKIFIEKSRNIDESSSLDVFNQQISNLIASAGDTIYSTEKIDTLLINNEIFSWLSNDSLISEKNKKLLYKIICSAKNKTHKQIRTEFEPKKIKNPVRSVDNEFALIGVVKYIQQLRYFSPNGELFNLNIEQLLLKYMPESNSCSTIIAYLNIINQIASEINDSHTVTYSFKKRLRLTLIEVNDTLLVVRNQTNLDTIQKGDILTEINGKPVSHFCDSIAKTVSGSTDQARKNMILGRLLTHDDDQSLNLTFINSNNNKYKIKADANKNNIPYHIHSKKEIKTIMKNKSDTAYYMIDSIGYINTFWLSNNKIKRAFKTLKNSKALIIDIREYSPRRLLSYNRLVKYISDKKGRYLDLYLNSNKTPGIFVKNYITNIVERIHVLSVNNRTHIFNKYYSNKPIVVLIDVSTISYMEHFGIALKYCRPDAIFLGRSTNGTVGVSSSLKLHGNYRLQISSSLIYNSEGKKIQGVGILPDISVKFNTKNIIKRNDYCIDEAVDYLKRKN